MIKFFEIILFPLRLILLLLVYIYKFVISPILPKCCIYYPTCSTYMLQSIKEWGLIKGGWLGTKRICRCMPFRKGGIDYVPCNVKGESKWIF